MFIIFFKDGGVHVTVQDLIYELEILKNRPISKVVEIESRLDSLMVYNQLADDFGEFIKKLFDLFWEK